LAAPWVKGPGDSGWADLVHVALPWQESDTDPPYGADRMQIKSSHNPLHRRVKAINSFSDQPLQAFQSNNIYQQWEATCFFQRLCAANKRCCLCRLITIPATAS
jgi:hypothetical protein